LATAALELCREDDLTEIGLSPAAAATIAGHVRRRRQSRAGRQSRAELVRQAAAAAAAEQVVARQEVAWAAAQAEVAAAAAAAAHPVQPEEPESEPPSGPMAAFDEAAVLAWVGSVRGLTAAQRAAARERMAEDEYDGEELAVAKTKSLLR
jgi:hypothetical protein